MAAAPFLFVFHLPLPRPPSPRSIMSSNNTDTNTPPVDGEGNNDSSPLGLSWEIGVIIAIILVVVAIIAAVIFQRRRRRRSALHLVDDLERHREQHRPRAGTRPSSSFSATLKEKEPQKTTDTNVSDTGESTIAKPEASAKRSSRTSFFPEHPSQMPPKYYWDHR
ncbi:hypothetical protein GYMLUDRAFT_41700 [Collybiopsis luxurians FD-317 M1]|uniref:Uncharacterized protein n=1 Tax=Collybiopsis luxurians FD-317 M1 TaxID=944289 RepID=A0A0D0CJ80_9AGAR|nr:hypothetical protein GYMLUDRAFT_41700 [Collybiopsis luxurians FD-317 M1]